MYSSHWSKLLRRNTLVGYPGDESKRKKNMWKGKEHCKVQGLRYSEPYAMSKFPPHPAERWAKPENIHEVWNRGRHSQLLIASEQVPTPAGFSFLQGNIKWTLHSVWPLPCCQGLIPSKKCAFKKEFCTKPVKLFKPSSLRITVEMFQGLHFWVRKCELIVDPHTKGTQPF